MRICSSGGLGRAEAPAQVLVVRRLALEVARRDLRHRHLALVAVVVLLRHDQREVRRQVAGQQEERLVVGLSALEELPAGLRDLPVVRHDHRFVAGVEVPGAVLPRLDVRLGVVGVAAAAEPGMPEPVLRVAIEFLEAVAVLGVEVHLAGQVDCGSRRRRACAAARGSRPRPGGSRCARRRCG